MYRLIIADDEESIRNGIAHSLPWREWGYEVCALCSDGQEVLEQLKLVHERCAEIRKVLLLPLAGEFSPHRAVR